MICIHVSDTSMCQWEVHSTVLFTKCYQLALRLDSFASGMVDMTTYSTGP